VGVEPVEVLYLSDVDSIRRNVTFELTREKIMALYSLAKIPPSKPDSMTPSRLKT
jgi:hypothetical protein